MEIFKIIGFSIFSVILIITLKEYNKNIAIVLSIIAGALILIYSINELSNVISMLNILIENSGINSTFLLIILKVIGISYMIEFAKNVCEDAGESSIATKLEMAGKAIILSLSVPLIASLMNLLVDIV